MFIVKILTSHNTVHIFWNFFLLILVSLSPGLIINSFQRYQFLRYVRFFDVPHSVCIISRDCHLVYRLVLTRYRSHAYRTFRLVRQRLCDFCIFWLTYLVSVSDPESTQEGRGCKQWFLYIFFLNLKKELFKEVNFYFNNYRVQLRGADYLVM